MNRWPTLVALTLFFGGLDSAQAQVVTLSAMRAKALQTRPALAMQDARVASAEAGVDEARAPARPKVAGRLEATASPGSELVTVRDAEDGDTFIVAGSRAIDDGSDAFLPQFRYAARVGVDWNIWDFGRTDAATRAARAELKARQAEAAHTRQSLVAAVDEVYLEWLGAHERASLEAETIRHLDTKLGSLKSKVEAGGLAPSALLSIQADLAAARLRQSYADGAVSLARLAVSEAVGQPLQDSASPDASLLALGAPEKAKTTVDRTEEALAARIEAARATADLHDKRFLPQLQASASAGLRGQFSTLFPFYSARLALELPFDDGGLGAAKAAAARANAKALEKRREQHLNAQRQTQTRQQLHLQQARSRVELAEALVKVTQARVVDAEQRFEESAASAGELTQARAQQSQAAAQLLTAKLDRTRAALALSR